MFFGCNRNASSTQVALEINNVYGEGSVSERTVRRWFERFQSFDTSLDDQPKSGRPHELDNAALINLVHENNRQTTRELATQLGVDQSTVVRHLEALGFKSLLGVGYPMP